MLISNKCLYLGQFEEAKRRMSNKSDLDGKQASYFKRQRKSSRGTIIKKNNLKFIKPHKIIGEQ